MFTFLYVRFLEVILSILPKAATQTIITEARRYVFNLIVFLFSDFICYFGSRESKTDSRVEIVLYRKSKKIRLYKH